MYFSSWLLPFVSYVSYGVAHTPCNAHIEMGLTTRQRHIWYIFFLCSALRNNNYTVLKEQRNIFVEQQSTNHLYPKHSGDHDSWLQKHLRISYHRAKRVVQNMISSESVCTAATGGIVYYDCRISFLFFFVFFCLFFVGMVVCCVHSSSSFLRLRFVVTFNYNWIFKLS